jgi:hypothetical protein
MTGHFEEISSAPPMPLPISPFTEIPPATRAELTKWLLLKNMGQFQMKSPISHFSLSNTWKNSKSFKKNDLFLIFSKNPSNCLKSGG